MGHVANSDRAYRLLQQRLDRDVTGAPDSPVFIRILKLLFAPDEADFARRLPSFPTPLGKLARQLGIPEVGLARRLTEMAERGLVVDFQNGGERYYALAPVVIGFFELTFMRVRDDLPLAELARLFDEYMNLDDRFARSTFSGSTQLGRTLVREEALSEDDRTEILDWERASEIVRSASAIGVSQCVCRHSLSHLGKACDAPMRCCLSFNYAAESVVRNGFGEPLTKAEAMRVLEQCKAAGLAQTADNVQRKVAYICNCCGCCCGMVQAIKTFEIRNAIVSSNWIVEVDLSKCTGCGKCVRACLVDALSLESRPEEDEKKQRAVCDGALCLGCGVCHSVCKSGAIRLRPRERRVFTPETIFDRVAAMAIERGRLAETLFADPERLSHRALGRVLSLLEKSPPYRAAMAIEPLRSVFMKALVRGARAQAGKLGDYLG